MIAIIDYGVGNLFSLKSSLAQLGQDTVVTADPDTIRKADRLILPGVGAFGDAMDKSLKVPQIGWNALHIVKDDPLFQYIREGEYVYYVHSYYGKNCTESTLATSEYSIPVTGAVRAGKVYGTQFHPEKSGDTGLRILKAFAEL